MEKLTNYMEKVFGFKIKLNDIPGTDLKGLPFFIKEAYRFRYGLLRDVRIIFIELKGNEIFTPQQFKKHTEIIHDKLNDSVILLLPALESYNRNRLIQNKINFIIPGKQIFIPELLIDLKEYIQPVKKQTEYLQPAAQCLLFYHLQHKDLNDKTYRELAKILDYTYKTITRAVENLIALNLCRVTDTKTKHLQFEISGKELWDKAVPFLTKPFIKTGYLDELLPEQYLFRTNITALAHYTMIAEDKKTYFAIYNTNFNRLNKENKIMTFNDYDGRYFLEVWKYNPKTLAKKEFVDPLSLYMIFRDDVDERIEMECEKLLNEVPW